MAADREAAQALNAAMKRLDLNVQSLFDARTRGDVDDFVFYLASLDKCMKSVGHWAGQLKPRSIGEDERNI